MSFLDGAREKLMGAKANMTGLAPPKVAAPMVQPPKGPGLNIPLEPPGGGAGGSPARKRIAVIMAEKKAGK